MAILNIAPEDDDGQSAKQKAMDSGKVDFQKEMAKDFPRKKEDMEKGPDYLILTGKYRNHRLKDIDIEELRHYYDKYVKGASNLTDLKRETKEMLEDWLDNYETYSDIQAEIADE